LAAPGILDLYQHAEGATVVRFCCNLPCSS
jgi:hypothetical protein